MKLLTTLVTLPFLFSFYAHGIVMRHDVSQSQYQVDQSQYASVIDLHFLTGTLIAPQWVLTAAHGVGYMPNRQKITIKQQTYYVEFIVQHPEYNKDTLVHDIALLKLDRAVTNVASTDIYTLDDEKSQHVWFVGKGDVGNGLLGVVGSSKVLNHAENMVEDAKGGWLTFDFDAPTNNALALEGISGPGDSGGPAFISTASGLKVAAVSSHQRNNNDGEGLYGVHEYYTRTSSHQKWIVNVMQQKHSELAEMSVKRISYSVVEATQVDKEALFGRYLLDDGSEFFIESCAENVCYRWGNSSSQTVLLKTTEKRWFAPEINRVLRLQPSESNKVNLIIMDDFHGIRTLTKQHKDQVTALKSRISTRGRQLLTHFEPKWPQQAVKNKIEGSVIMSFSINTDGTVDNIKVLNSAPNGIFEQVSIDALSKWRYAPLAQPLDGIKTRFDFTL
ncbi:TonB family protein [uncultured Paraglaciecola sp.]|uniref:TonB family protein n=1 Tax=uncultured Paraglaciecola sp. TaxID=1765024 RepID=UPI00260FA9A5|nr:TonB family protein [uncultured Paraglaciecola sp.]